MAQTQRRSHFVLAIVASFIDSFKRAVFSGGGGGGFTGTPPTSAVEPARHGTGFATVGQTVTTTGNFTAAADELLGCWFISATQPPCMIVGNTAVTGAPLVLTVMGLAPTTDAGAWVIGRGPTPTGSVSAAPPPVHFDRNEYTVTAADAEDLPAARLLFADFVTIYVRHCEDALAHLAPDGENAPPPSDLQGMLDAINTGVLSDLEGLANSFKVAYNEHRSQSGVHASNDSAHGVGLPDATNLDTLCGLLNALKSSLNAHAATGLAMPSMRVVEG